ncbi:MAG: ABC transporter ATP-binding protein, partial [Candidatus Brocadiia bacterium]|nr:ABC transporter ATP-binding protein [Candidatus Brocadiia bacterium]
MAEAAEKPLLEVRDLATHFYTEQGVARAVDGVSFDVRRGETFCIVGESGCGKTMTALSILRLVSPPGRIVAGRVEFEGQDLLRVPDKAMRSIRGRQIGMVFQEPTTSLNPVFTAGNQIAEAITAHLGASRKKARGMALEMLEKVRIPEPGRRLESYPHQMSGGMQQRVMIGMALACTPSLLIADEPTTALDVTIQAQILELLRELQREMGMSVLLITHDLGVVAEVADSVAVMYAGRIVESAGVKPVFRDPLHPYMVSLLKSLPTLGSRQEKLRVIPGQVPDPRRFPTGCRFHPRC